MLSSKTMMKISSQNQLRKKQKIRNKMDQKKSKINSPPPTNYKRLKKKKKHNNKSQRMLKKIKKIRNNQRIQLQPLKRPNQQKKPLNSKDRISKNLLQIN